MKRFPLVAGAAILAIGALALLLHPGGAVAQGKDASLSIGVVDIAKVFDSYARKDELEKKMAAEQKRFQETATKMQEEVRTFASNLELFDAGSDERRDAEQELKKKQIEFQAFLQQSKEDLVTMQSQSLETLYKNIVDVINAYAQEKNIDMVFRKDVPHYNRALPVKDRVKLVQYQIGNNKLVWSNPSLDITDAIIARVATAKAGEAK